MGEGFWKEDTCNRVSKAKLYISTNYLKNELKIDNRGLCFYYTLSFLFMALTVDKIRISRQKKPFRSIQDD